MLRRFSLLLILALSSGCGSGVSVLPTPSAAQLQAVDALLNGLVSGNQTPAISVGISRNGTVLYAKAYGNRTLSPAQPALVSTPFLIASMTKQFTTAAILLLQQDGKLSIDDPLVKYIPEYVQASKMTLRQMMTMTSGVPASDLAVWLQIPDLSVPNRPAVIAALNTLPLDFAPGTQMAYSNQGFWLLSIVIERASQTTYSAFLGQRIFGPLAMSSTYQYGQRPHDAEALGYTHTFTPDPFTYAPEPLDFDYLLGAGALVSTAGDLLKWNAALASGRVLNAVSYQTMLTVPTPAGTPIPTHVSPPGSEIIFRMNDGSPTMYAMGLFVPGGNYYWHSGGSNGFTSQGAAFNDGYQIVILTNHHLDSKPVGDLIPNLAPQIHDLLNPTVPASPAKAFNILALPPVPSDPPLN
jgi:D-alanyl-D-alanine carboxypeptidase